MAVECTTAPSDGSGARPISRGARAPLLIPSDRRHGHGGAASRGTLRPPESGAGSIVRPRTGAIRPHSPRRADMAGPAPRAGFEGAPSRCWRALRTSGSRAVSVRRSSSSTRTKLTWITSSTSARCVMNRSHGEDPEPGVLRFPPCSQRCSRYKRGYRTHYSDSMSLVTKPLQVCPALGA